jgi:hypothetical protein
MRSTKILKEHGLENDEVAVAYVQENNLNVLSHLKVPPLSKSSSVLPNQRVAASHSYLTCSSPIDTSDSRILELEAAFGPDNLRIATVDHDQNIVCFIVCGTSQQASRVPERYDR